MVLLIPDRTDAAYRRDRVATAEVWFLRGTPRFGGGPRFAPFPSALVVRGASREEVAGLDEVVPGRRARRGPEQERGAVVQGPPGGPGPPRREAVVERGEETPDRLERHDPDWRHDFYIGLVAGDLAVDAARFDELWAMHPEEFHVIMMHGPPVKTPRRQQAYGRDYQYTGRVNVALPPSPLVAPFLDWGREAIHPRLDGLLLDWYDGALGHYIGPHRDSTKRLEPGSPIVTVSLGEVRVFRLTSPKAGGRRDFPAVDGAVFVTPWETNLAWKHEVVKSARWKGRRISVTLQAFLD